MSITTAELRTYRSVNMSNTPANGGIMSSVEAVSGASSNLFPNASAAERLAGAVHYRKLFFKVANIDDIPLLSARIWQDSNTEGMDKVVFFPATQRDTQASITGPETLYGMGVLSTGVLAGGQTLVVDVEDGAVPIFRNGGLIRISNRPDPLTAGDEHWATVDQDPVVTGRLVTLHISTPSPVVFLSGTKVSSVYEPPNTIQASATAPICTSGAGTVAPATGGVSNLVASAIGSIEQSWTLTFTSPTTFDIVGDTVGAVGAGNVTNGATPNNAAFSKPYFTLKPALFSGAFALGDTVTFSTHPAAVALWVRRTIPSGTVATSNNRVSFYIDGETD